MECSGRYCDNVKLYCALVEYNPSISPPPRPLDEDLAQRFAPQMYFDQSSSQFPMPVSDYWKISKYLTNDYDFVDYNYRIMRN